MSKPETAADLRKRIAALLEQEEAHRAALKALSTERAEFEMRLTKTLCGVEVGCLVRHRRYGVCRVTSIGRYYLSAERPWLHGNQRNKGGEWSKQERQLFSDWELVET